MSTSMAPASRARLLAFSSAMLFGLTSVLVKVAAQNGMSGGQTTFVRFVFGVSLMLGLFWRRPGSFMPRRPWLLVLRGGFGGLAALFYYLAIEHIPPGEATLLNNLYPMFAVLLASTLLGERPTVHLGLALLIASTGVYLVLGGGHLSFGLSLGELFGFLSALCAGVAVTAIRALRKEINAATVFFAFALGGLLFSSPYSVGAWPAVPVVWVAAIGAALVAFLAQLAMTEAYGALSIPEAAVWQQLAPIASYLFSLTLGEKLGVWTVVGMLLGISGVIYGATLGQSPGRSHVKAACTGA